MGNSSPRYFTIPICYYGEKLIDIKIGNFLLNKYTRRNRLKISECLEILLKVQMAWERN